MRQLKYMLGARLAPVAAAAAGCLLLGAGVARATATVRACDGGAPNHVWIDNSEGRLATCGAGSLDLNGTPSSPPDSVTATAPPGLDIVGGPPLLPPTDYNPDDAWTTVFTWSAGQVSRIDVGCGNSPPGTVPCGQSGPWPVSLASPSFTIALICNYGLSSACDGAATLDQTSPDLVVAEATQPTLAAAAGSLGSSSGWVRGTVPLDLRGDSPSGLCSISATLGGLGVGSTSSTQDISQWKQCSSTSLTGNVDTTKFANGAEAFVATAKSAAGNTAVVDRTVNVDNSTPSVAIAGHADVPVGGQPAQLTATATAGPSGVGEISCNVDGITENFPEAGTPTASASLAVSGVGPHAVSCVADATASDAQGNHAWSAVASRTVKIRVPTAALATFGRLIDARQCRTRIRRVRVRAGWHTIRWHGHKVRARLPAHTAKRKIRVCRERVVRRRIVVYRSIKRHHHTVRVKRHRTVHVPVAPHLARKMIRTVRYGHRTHLSGQLLTRTGQALADQPVVILAIPRNSRRRFRKLATTRTNKDGVWHAVIPRGPGRVLEARYPGSSTDEPATSDQVRTIVHARVKLSPIDPPRVPWLGQITLRGVLPGGHLPHRGINLRLVYGVGHQSTTYAVRQHVGARGHNRFQARFQFGAGPAGTVVRYFFRVCTLPSPDYPFADGCSAKRSMLVGGDPPAPAHHPRQHHRRHGAHHRHHHHHRRRRR